MREVREVRVVSGEGVEGGEADMTFNPQNRLKTSFSRSCGSCMPISPHGELVPHFAVLLVTGSSASWRWRCCLLQVLLPLIRLRSENEL